MIQRCRSSTLASVMAGVHEMDHFDLVNDVLGTNLPPHTYLHVLVVIPTSEALLQESLGDRGGLQRLSFSLHEQRRLTLMGVVVGEGNAFEISICRDETNNVLKDVIKMLKPNTMQCDVDHMQLYLGFKDGNWLTMAEYGEVVQGRSSGTLASVMAGFRLLQPFDHVGDALGALQTPKNRIHVLVVLPPSTVQPHDRADP
ncbi:hypothetical protein B5M09_012887 [Aphanomyces astaci]|uniref:Crinkler effector protein N-terminal domain-containing protein n=1 Tax=Aphanomyces astaci TaxID=112090 RepID=A0A3R7X866_APHAT|nr:hypothetical protein B5M09_012887 [Aphanomyces astaci]